MVKLKKIVSVLLLLIYVGYYVNTVCFYHMHIIDGEITAHSHMHKESHHNSQSGGHTKQDIIFISQVSHFDYLDFSCDCVLKPSQFSIQENKFTETTHWTIPIHLENLSLRAPPMV